jgi:hypothetical protein
VKFFALLLTAALAAPLVQVQGQAPAARPNVGGTAAASGAVLRGLDKIAGLSRDISLQVGESANFGRLTITLTECRYPGGDPAADGFAQLVIHDSLRNQVVFRGWMIASSPALSALDHPRYDVWLIRCSSS